MKKVISLVILISFAVTNTFSYGSTSPVNNAAESTFHLGALRATNYLNKSELRSQFQTDLLERLADGSKKSELRSFSEANLKFNYSVSIPPTLRDETRRAEKFARILVARFNESDEALSFRRYVSSPGSELSQNELFQVSHSDEQILDPKRTFPFELRIDQIKKKVSLFLQAEAGEDNLVGTDNDFKVGYKVESDSDAENDEESLVLNHYGSMNFSEIATAQLELLKATHDLPYGNWEPETDSDFQNIDRMSLYLKNTPSLDNEMVRFDLKTRLLRLITKYFVFGDQIIEGKVSDFNVGSQDGWWIYVFWNETTGRYEFVVGNRNISGKQRVLLEGHFNDLALDRSELRSEEGVFRKEGSQRQASSGSTVTGLQKELLQLKSVSALQSGYMGSLVRRLKTHLQSLGREQRIQFFDWLDQYLLTEDFPHEEIKVAILQLKHQFLNDSTEAEPEPTKKPVTAQSNHRAQDLQAFVQRVTTTNSLLLDKDKSIRDLIESLTLQEFLVMQDSQHQIMIQTAFYVASRVRQDPELNPTIYEYLPKDKVKETAEVKTAAPAVTQKPVDTTDPFDEFRTTAKRKAQTKEEQQLAQARKRAEKMLHKSHLLVVDRDEINELIDFLARIELKKLQNSLSKEEVRALQFVKYLRFDKEGQVYIHVPWWRYPTWVFGRVAGETLRFMLSGAYITALAMVPGFMLLNWIIPFFVNNPLVLDILVSVFTFFAILLIGSLAPSLIIIPVTLIAIPFGLFEMLSNFVSNMNINKPSSEVISFSFQNIKTLLTKTDAEIKKALESDNSRSELRSTRRGKLHAHAIRKAILDIARIGYGVDVGHLSQVSYMTFPTHWFDSVFSISNDTYEIIYFIMALGSAISKKSLAEIVRLIDQVRLPMDMYDEGFSSSAHSIIEAIIAVGALLSGVSSHSIIEISREVSLPTYMYDNYIASDDGRAIVEYIVAITNAVTGIRPGAILDQFQNVDLPLYYYSEHYSKDDRLIIQALTVFRYLVSYTRRSNRKEPNTRSELRNEKKKLPSLRVKRPSPYEAVLVIGDEPPYVIESAKLGAALLKDKGAAWASNLGYTQEGRRFDYIFINMKNGDGSPKTISIKIFYPEEIAKGLFRMAETSVSPKADAKSELRGSLLTDEGIKKNDIASDIMYLLRDFDASAVMEVSSGMVTFKVKRAIPRSSLIALKAKVRLLDTYIDMPVQIVSEASGTIQSRSELRGKIKPGKTVDGKFDANTFLSRIQRVPEDEVIQELKQHLSWTGIHNFIHDAKKFDSRYPAIIMLFFQFPDSVEYLLNSKQLTHINQLFIEYRYKTTTRAGDDLARAFELAHSYKDGGMSMGVAGNELEKIMGQILEIIKEYFAEKAKNPEMPYPLFHLTGQGWPYAISHTVEYDGGDAMYHWNDAVDKIAEVEPKIFAVYLRGESLPNGEIWLSGSAQQIKERFLDLGQLPNGTQIRMFYRSELRGQKIDLSFYFDVSKNVHHVDIKDNPVRFFASPLRAEDGSIPEDDFRMLDMLGNSQLPFGDYVLFGYQKSPLLLIKIYTIQADKLLEVSNDPIIHELLLKAGKTAIESSGEFGYIRFLELVPIFETSAEQFQDAFSLLYEVIPEFYKGDALIFMSYMGGSSFLSGFNIEEVSGAPLFNHELILHYALPEMDSWKPDSLNQFDETKRGQVRIAMLGESTDQKRLTSFLTNLIPHPYDLNEFRFTQDVETLSTFLVNENAPHLVFLPADMTVEEARALFDVWQNLEEQKRPVLFWFTGNKRGSLHAFARQAFAHDVYAKWFKRTPFFPIQLIENQDAAMERIEIPLAERYPGFSRSELRAHVENKAGGLVTTVLDPADHELLESITDARERDSMRDQLHLQALANHADAQRKPSDGRIVVDTSWPEFQEINEINDPVFRELVLSLLLDLKFERQAGFKSSPYYSRGAFPESQPLLDREAEQNFLWWMAWADDKYRGAFRLAKFLEEKQKVTIQEALEAMRLDPTRFGPEDAAQYLGYFGFTHHIPKRARVKYERQATVPKAQMTDVFFRAELRLSRADSSTDQHSKRLASKSELRSDESQKANLQFAAAIRNLDPKNLNDIRVICLLVVSLFQLREQGETADILTSSNLISSWQKEVFREFERTGGLIVDIYFETLRKKVTDSDFKIMLDGLAEVRELGYLINWLWIQKLREYLIDQQHFLQLESGKLQITDAYLFQVASWLDEMRRKLIGKPSLLRAVATELVTLAWQGFSDDVSEFLDEFDQAEPRISEELSNLITRDQIKLIEERAGRSELRIRARSRRQAKPEQATVTFRTIASSLTRMVEDANWKRQMKTNYSIHKLANESSYNLVQVKFVHGKQERLVAHGIVDSKGSLKSTRISLGAAVKLNLLRIVKELGLNLTLDTSLTLSLGEFSNIIYIRVKDEEEVTSDINSRSELRNATKKLYFETPNGRIAIKTKLESLSLAEIPDEWNIEKRKQAQNQAGDTDQLPQLSEDARFILENPDQIEWRYTLTPKILDELYRYYRAVLRLKNEKAPYLTPRKARETKDEFSERAYQNHFGTLGNIIDRAAWRLAGLDPNKGEGKQLADVYSLQPSGYLSYVKGFGRSNSSWEDLVPKFKENPSLMKTFLKLAKAYATLRYEDLRVRYSTEHEYDFMGFMQSLQKDEFPNYERQLKEVVQLNDRANLAHRLLDILIYMEAQTGNKFLVDETLERWFSNFGGLAIDNWTQGNVDDVYQFLSVALAQGFSDAEALWKGLLSTFELTFKVRSELRIDNMLITLVLSGVLGLAYMLYLAIPKKTKRVIQDGSHDEDPVILRMNPPDRSELRSSDPKKPILKTGVPVRLTLNHDSVRNINVRFDGEKIVVISEFHTSLGLFPAENIFDAPPATQSSVYIYASDGTSERAIPLGRVYRRVSDSAFRLEVLDGITIRSELRGSSLRATKRSEAILDHQIASALPRNDSKTRAELRNEKPALPSIKIRRPSSYETTLVIEATEHIIETAESGAELLRDSGFNAWASNVRYREGGEGDRKYDWIFINLGGPELKTIQVFYSPNHAARLSRSQPAVQSAVQAGESRSELRTAGNFWESVIEIQEAFLNGHWDLVISKGGELNRLIPDATSFAQRFDALERSHFPKSLELNGHEAMIRFPQITIESLTNVNLNRDEQALEGRWTAMKNWLNAMVAAATRHQRRGDVKPSVPELFNIEESPRSELRLERITGDSLNFNQLNAADALTRKSVRALNDVMTQLVQMGQDAQNATQVPPVNLNQATTFALTPEASDPQVALQIAQATGKHVIAFMGTQTEVDVANNAFSKLGVRVTAVTTSNAEILRSELRRGGQISILATESDRLFGERLQRTLNGEADLHVFNGLDSLGRFVGISDLMKAVRSELRQMWMSAIAA